MANPFGELKEFAEKSIVKFYAILGIAILIGAGLGIAVSKLSVDEVCFSEDVFGKKVCLPGDPVGHIVFSKGADPTHEGVPGKVTLYSRQPVGTANDCSGTKAWVTASPATTLPAGYQQTPSTALLSGTSNPQQVTQSSPGFNFSVTQANCYVVGFEEISTGSTIFSGEFWEEPQNIHLNVVACKKNTGWEWVDGLNNCM